MHLVLGLATVAAAASSWRDGTETSDPECKFPSETGGVLDCGACLPKATGKALAAQDVLDAAVHAGALRQLHARAARVFGSRQKADAAAADWREKNRAFQRENCTDVDPKKKLLDGDAARPTTIFDDDQGTCAAAAMPPAPSPANRAREGS